MISIVFAAILALSIALVTVVFITLKNPEARLGMRIAYRWGTVISASLLLYAIGGSALFIYGMQYDLGLFAWLPNPYVFVPTLMLALLLFWPVAVATLAVRYFRLRSSYPH